MAMVEYQKPAVFSPAPYVRFGYLVIFLAFGVFGAWAMSAPLAGGVVANGMLSVETNRKTVQHLEGGIVDKLLVKEGDMVEAGQPLVILDSTQAQGNYAVLIGRQLLLQATEARQVAENIAADSIDFPKAVLADQSEEAKRAVAVQRSIFQDRNATRLGQINIIKNRIDQLGSQLEGLQIQLDSAARQRDSLDEEIARLTAGHKSGVISTNQLSQLARQSILAQGTYGEVLAEIAQAEESRSEMELQIIQINQEFKERASEELRDTRASLNEATEKVIVAEDILNRTTIRAPVRGIVQGLQVHSAQAVIRGGEPIMDIIPLDDDLIVNVHVRPLDIDSVTVGSKAEIKFNAIESRNMPAIFGVVDLVSQDVVEPTDGRTPPYYTARVRVDDIVLPDGVRERLLPGMPADVIIATGERTLFEYIAKPIEEAFSKGMREK